MELLNKDIFVNFVTSVRDKYKAESIEIGLVDRTCKQVRREE